MTMMGEYFEGASKSVTYAALPHSIGRRPSPQDLVISVSSRLEELADIWPRSAGADGASLTVFQSAEFLNLWLVEIGRRQSITPVLVAVRDAEGEPLMLLPLGLSRRQGARVLTFLDAGAVDYNGPVLFAACPDWSAAEMGALWRRIEAVLPAHDVLDLGKMLVEIGGRPNPLLHLGATAWECSGHAVVLSRPDGDAKLPNARASRRKLKRLNEIAPSRFAFVEGTAAAGAAFETLIAHKARRFEETRVPGFDRFPGLVELYRAALTDAGLAGQARLAVLYCGDTAIAEQWCLVSGDRLVLLVCANAGGSWSHCSPGRLLNEWLIAWARDNGFGYVDFGIGDEAYKAEYCDVRVELAGVTRAVTARGRAAVRLRDGLARLRTTQAYQAVRNVKYAAVGWLKR